MDRCFCKNKTGCPELWSTFLPGYQAQNEPRRFDISISNAVGLQDNALDTSHQDEFRNNGENRCRKQDKSGGDAAYDNHTPNRTPKLDRDRGYPIRGPRFPYRAADPALLRRVEGELPTPPYFLDFFFSSFSRFFACSSRNSLSNREIRQRSSSESAKWSHSARRASYLI